MYRIELYAFYLERFQQDPSVTQQRQTFVLRLFAKTAKRREMLFQAVHETSAANTWKGTAVFTQEMCSGSNLMFTKV